MTAGVPVQRVVGGGPALAGAKSNSAEVKRVAKEEQAPLLQHKSHQNHHHLDLEVSSPFCL